MFRSFNGSFIIQSIIQYYHSIITHNSVMYHSKYHLFNKCLVCMCHSKIVLLWKCCVCPLDFYVPLLIPSWFFPLILHDSSFALLSFLAYVFLYFQSSYTSALSMFWNWWWLWFPVSSFSLDVLEY